MLLRRTLPGLLLSLACIGAAHADAIATDEALRAFFSMDAARIEGAQADPAPEGFEAGSESDLIAFLQAEKKGGADLNAYRHLAPMLHHAVRAGMNETAAWLLRNGANPLLPLNEPTESTPGTEPAMDAVAVAIVVGNWKAFDLLMKHPAIKRLPPEELARKYWPFASRSSAATEALIARKFPVPSYGAVPKVATGMLINNLCNGQLSIALATLAAEPEARPEIDAGAAARCATTAEGVGPGKTSAAISEAQQWRQLQDRLKTPMWAFTLRHAQTAAQLGALERAGVRPDWTDGPLARQTVLVVLQQNRAVLRDWLRLQPGAPLQATLKDEEVFRAWLRAASGRPMDELRWALQQVAPEQLGRKLPEVMSDWDSQPATGRSAKDPNDQLQRWTALTQRLPARLPDSAKGSLPYQVPLALWADWLQRGFHVSDQDWAGWIRWVDLDQLQKAWPILGKYQPEVTRRSLTWLVAPLSVGAIDDPVAQAQSTDGARYWYATDDAKARFLHANGARVANPRWLAAAFAEPDARKDLAFELAQGLVKDPPAELRKQLVVVAPLGCQPVAGPALRRSLAPRSSGPSRLQASAPDAAGDIDMLQPLAQPGVANCLWLGTGGEGGGRKFIDDESFFEGVNRLTPCADSNRSTALWDEKTAGWLALADGPTTAWIVVRKAGGAETALVSFGENQGGCGEQAGGIYQMRAGESDSTKRIAALPATHPLAQALSLQCNPPAIEACFGLASDAVRDNGPLPLEAFADLHWAGERDAFLAAVNALDHPALRAALDQGVFAHWGRLAIQQVSASSVDLEGTRRRMAWLLAQRQFLRDLDDATLSALAGWLPAQDWGPITQTMRCSNVYALQSLAQTLEKQGSSALGLRLRSAIATPCAAKRS